MSTPDPMLGEVLDGRYKVEKLLGRGGMGRVYRAEHVGIGRAVAVKVLDPRGGFETSARQRFEREAIATGKLRHPNCVGVTDFGMLPGGSLFLVMELLDGVTVDDVLADHTRLPLPRAVAILRHVLRGLAHAHGQGLVHRDLTPRNVILVPEPDDPDFAKVVDFGLAKMTGADTGATITQTGIVCGTPSYMSTEQALGKPLDHRSDLYAATILLFEMLTGRPPFQCDEALRTLSLHISAPPPTVAEIAPDVIVPPALDRLIARGLAKRPEDRPQSADEYLAELDRAMAAPAQPTQELSVADISIARPVTPRPPTTKLKQRRIWQAAGLAAIVLVAGIAVGLSRSGSAADTPDARPAEVPAAAIEMPEEARPTVDPAIEAARRLAASGRRQQALDKLRALRKDRPRDAAIPYELGRVYLQLNWPKQVLESWRDAIRLDPALREDPGVIRGVVSLLDSKSTWPQASRFLERELGAAAIPALTATAKEHPSRTVRGRASSILRRLEKP
jgi:eukaryotic-like serine/threonine-protein kinase